MDKISIIGVSGKNKEPALTKEQERFLLDNAAEIAKAVNEAYKESERKYTRPLSFYQDGSKGGVL